MKRWFVVVVVVVVAFCSVGCEAPSFDAAGPIATGTTPNDVVLSVCGGAQVALVTASGDARLDVLSPAGEQPARAVFLGEGTQPWMVDVVELNGRDDDDGGGDGRAVVSLFGSDEVALVSACDERVLSRATADVVIDVDPPITLRSPTDADDDGAPELVVSRMVPRSPQAVVVVDDAVFVSFTNLFAVAVGDEPMLAGPGLLARFALDGDSLRFVEALTLPCENPGGLRGDGDGVVVVGCSGRFVATPEGLQRQSPGGLVVVDVASFSIAAAVAVPDFSAGTPGFFDGDIVVGNVLGGELRRYDRDLALVDSVVLGGANESIFSVLAAGDDVAAALFVQGALVLDPFGAQTAIPVASDGPARGLIDAVLDDDDRVLGLLSLSAELVPVELP